MNEYATGDQIAVTGQLLIDQGAGEVPDTAMAGATWKAIKADRSGLATGTSTVVPTLTDPVAMRIAAVWPSAQTRTIEPGTYLVEAQGTLGGEPVTYRVAKIKIVKGVTV